jgi:putative transcriptional regulator
MESLRGKLLLSAPQLFDPNFRRSVVLIAEHTDEGAMGLVLNRQAQTTVAEAVPDLAWIAPTAEEPIYAGGPVAADSVIVLAEFDDPYLAAAIVIEDVGFIPAEGGDQSELAASTRRTRVFAGHAGWGPGQLEAEMDEQAWLVADPLPDDVFTEDPENLWSRVVGRKGRKWRLLATMPVDPSAN